MENFDPRGGSNRYKFQADFFKKWSNEMAYALGFLYADGDITDAALSSRTQYIRFTNKERGIIEKIKSVLKAEHPIHSRPPHLALHWNGKLYKSSEIFYLRIGSKRMFADVIKLGLLPNKSKVMKFPFVSYKHLSHFIRGYFDGDGTIYVRRKKGFKQKAVIIFSSGSKAFLKSLSNLLAKTLKIRHVKVHNSTRCFQIRFSAKESINKIFNFMYKNSYGLFLKRKFKIFDELFHTRTDWLNKEVISVLNKNKKNLATYPSR